MQRCQRCIHVSNVGWNDLEEWIHHHKRRLCKVVKVSSSKIGKHEHDKCHFVAIDIFNSKKLEDIIPSSHDNDFP